MVFTVLVAADLFGTKTNYELDFLDPPAMAELRARLESVFGNEAAQRRPPGVPASPFQAHRMQVFDDKVELWVDLVSAGQLHDYCQVYVFQRETPWHKEVQSKIPPPGKPPIQTAVLPAVPSPMVVGPPPVVPLPPVLGSPGRVAGSPFRATPALAVGSLPRGSPYRATPTAAALTADLPNRPPPMVRQETTHGDKVRCVYDDLDKARSGAVRAEDFLGAIDRLRIDLAGKAEQIFDRADVNKDGVLSFGEFERFAEIYPTVLDSLFYRNRDFWIDRRQKDGIESAQSVLANLRDREQQAKQALQEAADATAQQQQQVRIQDAEVEQARAREREAGLQAEAARGQTEEARQRASQRAAAVVAVREKERQATQVQSEAQYGLDAAKGRQASATEELGRAQRRLQDLERMLRDQQEEVQKQQELVGAAAGVVTDAELKVGTAQRELETAQGEARREQEQLSDAERETQRASERERELAAGLARAKDDTGRAAAKKDAEERELAARKAKEDARRQTEQEASGAVDKQQQTIAGLEDENKEHNGKRSQTESEEQALIANEVRIRDQRENLEREEAMLRDSHRNFHASTGRSDHHHVQSASPAPTHHFDAPSTSPRRLVR
eukprot:Hpha_TRINITY_DN15902_c0_g7::TRINITY_DN15902_c0_g7_i1::g.71149::m.71149